MLSLGRRWRERIREWESKKDRCSTGEVLTEIFRKQLELSV